MLLRPFIAHQGVAAQRARLITFRPTVYLCYRASASSAAQTEPSTVSSPEQNFSAVNIRQSTKTFSGRRWTVLSIPRDGSNVTRWCQNERNGDQNLSAKQAIILTRDNMLSTFLPRGYPHSVTPEYKGFAYWQMWHNMAGSVTSGK
jgi:Vitamin B6 photo-protection and homoeostasis